MIKFVGIAQEDNESLLYYSQDVDDAKILNVVRSSKGFEFSDKNKRVTVVNNKQEKEAKFQWTNFRVSRQDYKYFLTYKDSSIADGTLQAALSIDLVQWQTLGAIGIGETAAAVPNLKYKDQHVMYFGEKSIRSAYSSNLRAWKANKKALLAPRANKFDYGDLEAGNAYEIDGNILLTYYTKRDSGYAVGAACFDKKNPDELLWRTDEPVWEDLKQFDCKSMVPLGSTMIDDQLILYFLIDDEHIFAVACAIPTSQGVEKKTFSTHFKKSDKNPIIAPRPQNPWESRATFNSAAVYEDGKVHFVYRALGDTDLSVLGYATSTDGINIDERFDEPIYIPREPFETPGQKAFKSFADHFASGGGYGGVEDPRITKVGDKFFMTYVAFDGATPPRVALTSIDVDDFLDKKWDKWEKPKLISAPGMVNKNAVIFPEKINGKYVVFHRVYPNVLIDYVEDLEFDNYLQGHHFIPPRKKYWDSKKVGAGAPPIKTDDGWLFVYQAVGHQAPHQYKIGAMLLDLNNPSKVLARTSSPIVEPIENYENEGFKSGVVYPCGAVAFNNKLHVYYGGADTVVCAASADLDRFLYDMKKDHSPELKKVKFSLFN